MHLCEIAQIYKSLHESTQDFASLLNLRFNLRKIDGGRVIIKPGGLLEENKGR